MNIKNFKTYGYGFLFQLNLDSSGRLFFQLQNLSYRFLDEHFQVYAYGTWNALH